MTARDPGDWKGLAAWRLARMSQAFAARRFALTQEYIDRWCESPIEKLLAAAFVELEPLPRADWPNLNFPVLEPSSMTKLEEWFVHDVLREGMAAHLYSGLWDCWTAMMEPQVKIGPYRVDFGLVAAALGLADTDPERVPLLRIAIECDGHAYHERTKAQAAHDRAKDRYLQAQGITILRFTGSEIWSSPEDCRDEVIAHIKRWADPIIQADRQTSTPQRETAGG